MTDQELDAIEARANAATEGPWEADGDHAEPRVLTHCDPDRFLVARVYWDDDGKERHDEAVRTAAFIAAARTDVPALVAALREARGVLASTPAVYAGEQGVPGAHIWRCPFCKEKQAVSMEEPALEHHTIDCALARVLGAGP